MNAASRENSDHAEYWGRKEIAERLGVTERTIDLWRKTRGLPCYKPGGRVYFRLAEVEAWFRRGRMPSGERQPEAHREALRPTRVAD